jgi:hypothetical protein
MQVYARRLPATQRFLCSRNAIKELFAEDLAWVSFGEIFPCFRLDRRSIPRPRIDGMVVAALTVSPRREAYLQLFPVPSAEFPKEAVLEFNASILPKFREWLTAQLTRPETHVSGHETISAEWVDGAYRLHQVRRLYDST